MIGRCYRLILPFSILILLLSVEVQAATWRTTKGLSGSLVYTDNIGLTPTDERGGLTARITPGISLNGDGRRVKLGFGYAPSYLHRFYSGGTNEWVHNLTADLRSELYRDVFFLDARANAGLTLVDPFGTNPGDGINETDNTRQTANISISPYLLQRFGSFADMRLGYTYSRSWTDGFSGSDGHSANISLNSGRRFQVVDWDINGDFNRTVYSGGDDSIFAKLLARVGYRINRKLRINAYFGAEDNNFLRLADAVDEPDTDGTIYGAGATWNPSPRTDLDFAVAHRFFGTNLYFDFTHRNKRSVWTASLTHDPYNARNELLEQQTFQLTDPFGEPVLDPAGNPVFINPDTPLLTTEDYVRRRLNIGWSHSMRRGGLSAGAYYTERSYADDQRDTSNYGISANLSRRLLARINANLGVYWDSTLLTTDDVGNTTWNIRAGLSRQLGARTNLAFNLSHRRNNSDDPDREYTENRATLTLGTSW